MLSRSQPHQDPSMFFSWPQPCSQAFLATIISGKGEKSRAFSTASSTFTTNYTVRIKFLPSQKVRRRILMLCLDFRTISGRKSHSTHQFLWNPAGIVRIYALCPECRRHLYVFQGSDGTSLLLLRRSGFSSAVVRPCVSLHRICLVRCVLVHCTPQSRPNAQLLVWKCLLVTGNKVIAHPSRNLTTAQICMWIEC